MQLKIILKCMAAALIICFVILVDAVNLKRTDANGGLGNESPLTKNATNTLAAGIEGNNTQPKRGIAAELESNATLHAVELQRAKNTIELLTPNNIMNAEHERKARHLNNIINKLHIKRNNPESEIRKYKRHYWRKPNNFDERFNDLVILPYAEAEVWPHDVPKQQRCGSAAYAAMQDNSELNVVNLANMLFNKFNNKRKVTLPENRIRETKAKQLSIAEYKPESKLLQFLRNARAVGLIDEHNNPEPIALAPAVPASMTDDEELEIRCPVHHGPGGHNNLLGFCTCNIIKKRNAVHQLF